MWVNPQKSKLGFKDLDYLGYTIGGGQIKFQTKKIEAIHNLLCPWVKKQLCRFLGMAGYYSRFIPNFVAIACPLTDCLAKGRPDTIKWDVDTEEAVTQLKATLCTTPVLYSPNLKILFLLQTDASDYAIGAVLSQTHPDGEHPMVYLSRKLHPNERRHSTIEKEALAIKWAVETL